MPEEYLGQQWCKPSHTWGSNDKLFSEAISIASNQGPLILCNVYRTIFLSQISGSI